MTISERSGGSAPLFAALAARSFGNGERKWLDGSPGPCDGLALVVESARHLHRRRDRLDLVRRQADAREIAVVHQLHRVAVGADLGIDLEPPLRRREVEGAERPAEAPMLLGRRLGLLRPRRAERGAAEQQPRGESQTQRAHQCFSIGFAAAPEGNGPPPAPITGRLMLSGKGSGLSSTPSTGSSTRKCRK